MPLASETNVAGRAVRCVSLAASIVLIAAPEAATSERRDVRVNASFERLARTFARLELSVTSEAVFNRQSTSPTCGDERDDIIREYVVRDLSSVPSCGRLSASGGSRWFSFAELNSGDHRWAWIETALLDGLEGTRQAYGEPMIITSGYRCPEKNATVPGAATNSVHQFGRAVDVSATTLDEQDAVIVAATRQPGAKIIRYSSHVHLQW